MELTEQYLSEALRRLKVGEVVAFPTETFYGLAADPANRLGVTTLLALKSRGAAEGIPIIIDSSSRIEEWVEPSESEVVRAKRREIQQHLWPGPLTLVFTANRRAREAFHEGIFGRELSLAMRWSSDKTACDLARGLSGVVTATSANPKAFTPPCTALATRAYFPSLFIVPREDDYQARENISPSTLLDVREFPFKIVRAGAVSEEALHEWL